MSALAACATAVCIGALAAALWAEKEDRQPVIFVFEPIASLGFLAVAMTGPIWGRAFAIAVFAALVFSFFGDVFLMWRQRVAFLAGLVSFLLGHVAFAAAFVLGGLDLLWLACGLVLMTAVSVGIAKRILVHVDKVLRVPVIAYMAVITAMVALAIAHCGVSGRWWVPAGAAAFFASDISVARDRFTDAGFTNRMWGLPMYYVAQLTFAWGIALG